MPPMKSHFPDRSELEGVLSQITQEARRYLGALDELPVLSPRAKSATDKFSASLPDMGVGAGAALKQLIDNGLDDPPPRTIETSMSRRMPITVTAVSSVWSLRLMIVHVA